MFASHGIDADQNTAVCEAHRARRRGHLIKRRDVAYWHERASLRRLRGPAHHKRRPICKSVKRQTAGHVAKAAEAVAVNVPYLSACLATSGVLI